ncbi:MAG: 5-methyltetrahydropteroyltriglutamate--homocysteine methyltransferase, partial [Alphaproteobacteria bacterium]|nr:5-methyltetrahydropteroyltriglutamate--homocysteine methyltransferase [Alphaproteobacteria bacterium]
MAARSKPPFRADHVGSLLRPSHLIEAREKHKKGEITAADLKALEDKEVRAAVKLQEDAGLQSITDGDYRRGHWWMDFVSAIDGAAVEGGMPIHFQSAGSQAAWVPPKTVVKSKLKHARGISVDDFRFLRSATTRTPKQCVPSPSIMHFRGGRDAVDRTAYPEMGAFFT